MDKDQITATHNEAAPDEDVDSDNGIDDNDEYIDGPTTRKRTKRTCPVRNAGPLNARSDLASCAQTGRMLSSKPGTPGKGNQHEVPLAGVSPQTTEEGWTSPPRFTATEKGKGRAVDSPDDDGGAEPGPSPHKRMERTQSTRKAKRKVNDHDNDPYADAADQRRLKKQKQASMTSASGSMTRYTCTYPGCQKTYGREKDMVRHRKTHGAPTNFCEWCGKGFGRVDVLRRHCREIHEDHQGEQDAAVTKDGDDDKVDEKEGCSWEKGEEDSPEDQDTDGWDDGI